MKLGRQDVSEFKARNPRLTDDLLAELQSWVSRHSLPPVPLEQLAIFAHSCYYDKPATLRCMEVYYKMRANAPEFFNDRDPLNNNVQAALKTLNFFRLPKPLKDGSIVLFHSLIDTTPSSYVFNHSVKTFVMMVDACLYNEGCPPGYIFLFDMKGVRLGHLLRPSILGLRRFFEYIQDANPIRLKAIHVINCVWFMDKVLALIKPFMRKDFFDILHFHVDVAPLYQYIPPECLPKDFGGELDDVETFQAAGIRKIVELRDYFLEEEQLYRSYQSCPKKGSACAGAEELRASNGDEEHDDGS